jgi:hypothetical protein
MGPTGSSPVIRSRAREGTVWGGKSRLRVLAPRLARLAVFLSVVIIGLQLALAWVVKNRVEDSFLDLGAGLVQLDQQAPRQGPRIVELNGTRLRFASAAVDRSVEDVIDRAQDECGREKDKALKGGDGSRGFIACFVPAPAPLGPVVGEVREVVPPTYRYVYAQPGSEKTVVITVEAEGSALDLKALFPEEGDAPGADAPGVPRPPDARRTLSAREDGSPQQVTLYVTKAKTPAELEAWYRARLPDHGWRPLEGGRRNGGPRVLVADRKGTLAALVFDEDESGSASVAILTSL